MLLHSLALFLLVSIGSAVNPNDKGKRKLENTSFESRQFSSASQRLQHSGSPQRPQKSHHKNEPQQQQAAPLRDEMPRIKQPRPFDASDPELISISSGEKISDFAGQSGGHIPAAVPSADEEEGEDTETGIPLYQYQVSNIPQMGLEGMPTASRAQSRYVSRSKNTKQSEWDHLRNKKQTVAIHSLNEELGVANQYIGKWRKLDAYGLYIRWLEKILLKNHEGIRNSLTAAKEKAQPESDHQIQIFELYIKNAEENEEYEKISKNIFRVDQKEIFTKFDNELAENIQGITNQAEIKRLQNICDRRKDYYRVEYGKWTLLSILSKLELKKLHEVKLTFAIYWAKIYAKSLKENFLKYCVKELANPPNFLDDLPSTDQASLVPLSEMQPNKELERKEWESFMKDVPREEGIHHDKLILDAYRRDILWLEHLLLENRHKILWSLILSDKENLIPTFRLLLKSAETNRAYEYTADEHGDLFKLTPEEIANDPEAKRIHDTLKTIGKKKTWADIKNLAFEWARQYRKMLRENYLTAFQNVWKPTKDFMPHILHRNEKSGTASTNPIAGKENRQKMKQKIDEH